MPAGREAVDPGAADAAGGHPHLDGPVSARCARAKSPTVATRSTTGPWISSSRRVTAVGRRLSG